ncbi:FYN-binding protein 1 [Pelobates fuscus]|uniref:FYN-binding protein 1 n=1 Tax=Pelobates fuscus TaxID=191477 RepID=UPI002FE47743
MDTSSNVKSLAAKFNSVPHPMEDSEKSPVHPGFKGIQDRRAGFENNFSPAVDFQAKKPASPKPTYGLKPVTDEVKPSIARPIVGVNRIGGSFQANKETEPKGVFPKPPGFKPPDLHKEEARSPFPKPIGNKTAFGGTPPQEPRFGAIKSAFEPEHKENQEKPVFPKPSAIKGLNAATENVSKPIFPKKPQLGGKPPGNVGTLPTENAVSNNTFVTKTYSTSLDNKPFIQSKEPAESNAQANSRPTGIKSIQSPFLKQAEEEQNTGGPRPNFPVKSFQNKTSQDSLFPKLQSSGQVSRFGEKLKEHAQPSEPKKKTLTPMFKLGPAPQKPVRPPKVDLTRFKGTKGNGHSKGLLTEQRSSALSTALPPPPPLTPTTSAPTPNSSAKQPAGPPLPPSLPPRNIRAPTETTIPSDEEDYDDVDDNVFNKAFSLSGGMFPDDMSMESDEEFYEGIDQESTQHRKEEELKKDKQEKKRLEQAKKEQKEKEKKDQEMRKRFKFTGEIEVLHQARACNDYKGGKNELSFKQGEQIEIIRVTDNPEGKWLGRMKGCYGYIKTTMVNIDYYSLRRKKSTMSVPIKPHDSDQEIYDDVGEDESNHSASGSGAFFPPPPSSDEIYDGVDDGNDGSVPQDEDKGKGRSWGILQKLKGNDSKKKSFYSKSKKEDSEDNEFVLLSQSGHDNDVYDDVDSSDFPPPPLTSLSLNTKPLPGKPADKDYRTLKKMEKEEKEFRKKFKFNGEIRVLSSVQVAANLTSKKFGSKDLSLKPGESLDVIQNTNDTMILCRNNEGKYGYVLRSNLADDDGEIYDDIGEECIYDND